MILSSAVVKLKHCVGDPFDCEEGARCGAGDGKEVKRGLIRDIIECAFIGVSKGGVCEGKRGSTL